MLPPIRKSVTVPWDQATAFRRFTDGIGTWWPLRSHSVGQARAESVVFEGRVGGRIVERIRGGEESVWGTVTDWEPPRRVAFSWHPGGQPRHATRVEVTIEPHGSGSRLELVHANWEALGPIASTAHRGYPIGWTYVLAQWADRRHSPAVLAIGFMQWLMSPLAARMSRKAKERLEVWEAGREA